MGRQLLVSRTDPPTALEPANASLDHVPPPVFAFVESHPRLIASRRDNRFDRTPTQPRADPWITVSLVTGNRIGSATTTNAHRIHQRLEARRLVRLSRRDQHPQRDAATIGHKMKLRTKASAGSSQGVVGRFCFAPFFPAPAADRSARMFEPSTSNTLQSMRPSRSPDQPGADSETRIAGR